MFEYDPNRIAAAIFVVCMPIASAFAQLASSQTIIANTDFHLVSAAEAAQRVRQQAVQLERSISFRDAHYPKDSLLAVVAANAAQWLTQLQQRPIQGMQLDPAVQVGVGARNEAYAKAQITARLATPGLPLADRAFTLLTAVEAFASQYYPERLPTAEMYLSQLDALGSKAAPWQVEARSALVQAYYQLGRSTDVIRHGMTAMRIFKTMEYVDQSPPDVEFVYIHTVEALTGTSNARLRIDSLNAILRNAITPPATVLALDSIDFARIATLRKFLVSHFINTGELLGTVGSPFIANYWVNRPTHDSADVSLDDGKIRVVEMFSYGCNSCNMALHGLQRLQQQFPNVDVLGMTWTFGFWANRFVEPDEEARRLEEFFVNDLKVTLPIGIWKAKKVVQEDGGISPGVWNGPNNEHYPTIAKPMTWVFDGHGRVRKIILGGGREFEQELNRIVQFLSREAAMTQAAAN